MILFFTSYLIDDECSVRAKFLTKLERPHETGISFPSGHTSTVFAGAAFLWQEYNDVYVWSGISEYIAATGTSFFRIYNNKHWLTDAAGAGI
ncbi:MAG: phosphatase PAP2 family protein [Burkholderiales bacterium]|nr:phosphatase PAP2 family protein [Flavobacterium sp.]